MAIVTMAEPIISNPPAEGSGEHSCPEGGLGFKGSFKGTFKGSFKGSFKGIL